MRWDNLRLDGSDRITAARAATTRARAGRASRPRAAPALFERDAVARTFDTPGFRGMTFFEVHAKSIINQVRRPPAWRSAGRSIPTGAVAMPARTVLPGTRTPTWTSTPGGLQLEDRGQGERARSWPARSWPRRKWQGEHVAMGTNVDCYQRAEGRYRLMPGIIGALRDAGEPVLDPDQGHADPARPGPAGRGRGGHRRRPQRLGRLHRPRAVAVGRARYAQPQAPARDLRRADRARSALRGAHGPGPAVPLRLPRAARGHRAADRRGRAPCTSPRSCCTCARARGSGSCAGWARTTPSWWSRTAACTAAGRTHPRPTSSR